MQYHLILIALVHRNNQEIILIRRKREPHKGEWSLPGGDGTLQTEPNPFKAVVEEIRMDLCAEFKPNFYTMTYVSAPQHTLQLYFHGEISGEPRIRPETKTIAEIKWFPIREVLETKLAFEEQDKPVLREFTKRFSF